MTFEFREPKRENAPLLIGLSAGSGGGKTFSACLLARGLAGGRPFALIDTENGRALHYADYFPDMRHTNLREPFSPAAYTEAINAADAQGFPVIVVDSASHEYEGEGGVLRMQEAEFERLGSRDAVKMLSWVAPKNAHKAFVRQLLQVKAHVILCMRAEDKIEFVNGKPVAKQSLTSAEGWIPIMEKRLPFELTLNLLLTADKPGVPKPVKLQEQHKPMVPLDAPLTADVGKALAAWAAGGQASAGEPEAAKGGALIATATVADEPTGDTPSPADEPLVAMFVEELLSLIEADKQAAAVAAVQANREKHAADPSKHVAWLQSQIEKVREAIDASAVAS